MATMKKSRLKDIASLRRFLTVVSVTLLGVFFLVFVLGTNPGPSEPGNDDTHHTYHSYSYKHNHTSTMKKKLNLPKQNELSLRLEKLNELPPRNRDLYPNLAPDHTTIVLYVHNRPQYLKVVVESLSRVAGISETLLIVSHDGHFDPMVEIVRAIRFCQVKQIFAPFSPHLFPNSFPGASPEDCKGKKEDTARSNCRGTPDQYQNYRSPEITSLKHHWWWMMNTVWDGLDETRSGSGHVVFVEEDHFLYPNAYRILQTLISLKPEKCPECYAVNLAPSDVKSRGERCDCLVAERMGNVGYAFNRTVWDKIRGKAFEFCSFDDYNWDITMWARVYPSFGGPVYTLRGPRTSAVHFGKCGLHQGRDGTGGGCVDQGTARFDLDDLDRVVYVDPGWAVRVVDAQGYKAGFKGWGGWGDERDQQLCLSFARMYHHS